MVEVCAVVFLPLVARCIETIDVCIWHMVLFYVCCSDCVGVCGNDCCVAAVVKHYFFGVLKYFVCLCKGCDGCCVFVCIVTRGAVGARVWEV